MFSIFNNNNTWLKFWGQILPLSRARLYSGYKPTHLHFDPMKVIESDYFIKIYSENKFKFIDKSLYTVMIKCKFEDGRYRMLSTQFTYLFLLSDFENFNPKDSEFSYVFNDNEFNTKNPIDEFKTLTRPVNMNELYIYVISILYTLNENYDIDHMLHLSICFYHYKSLYKPEPFLKNVNKLPLNKNFINITRTKHNFSSKFLPLTLDESYYGKKMFNTLHGVKFYSTSRTFINEDNQTKIIVTDLSETITEKKVFSLKTNKLLESVLDTKINSNTFTRKINNLELTIQNKKILKSSNRIPLPTIKPISKNDANTFNKNIGIFDIETFLDTKSNITKVYALGFSHVNDNIDDPVLKMFYLSSGQDPSDLVISCINEMLKTKYNKTIFYTHNFGNFDVVFLYKILEKYNETNNVYKLDPQYRDDTLLKLTITSGVSVLPRQTKKSLKKNINSMCFGQDVISSKPRKINHNSITIVDSLNLLPDSLDHLSKEFGSYYKKSFFPYTFVTDKTLYYTGITPSIEYYHTPKKKMNLEDYTSLIKNNWNMVDETLFYLKNDLLSLLHIMYEYNKYIFNEFNIEVTKCLTITGVALNHFLANHYITPSLALINNKSIYKDIKAAYFGGLSEVYTPYGENLNYYDVNSLYPSIALKPMPGNNCDYIEDFTSEAPGLNLKDIFGYFYCTIKTNDDYLGLLPCRDKGLLTHPLGEWSGWYFTPLLEFVQNHGYEIKIHRGYNFNKVDNVFKSYVEQLYAIKACSKGSKKLMAKYLLNSLTGRFGMQIDKRITKDCTLEEYNKIVKTREVFNEKWISSNCVILTYSPEINYFICKQHDIDYIQELNSKNIDSEYVNLFNNVSIGISAAITSYASIFMSEVKLLIRSLGGTLYYMDTDSIVTDIKLPDNLVGSGLGKFKLEYPNLKRGYFISSKTYCLITQQNEEIIKSKGTYKESLTEKDFMKLLVGYDVEGVKGNSRKSFELGYVRVGETKPVKIHSDSYKKRIKIRDPISNLWVGTKPLVIVRKNLNLSLVLWINKYNLIVFTPYDVS